MPLPRRIVLASCAAVVLLSTSCVIGPDGIALPSARESVEMSQPTISPPSATLKIGETVTLRKNGMGSAVFWRSSDGSVATVTQAGRVTATGPGVAVIIATSGAEFAGAGITVTK